MSNNARPREALSEETTAELLKLAIEPEDPIGDTEAMANLPPQDLWGGIRERWQCLTGRPTADEAVEKTINETMGQLLGVSELTVKRWTWQTQLPLPVRRRLAALSELLFLLASRKIRSITETDLLTLIAALRGVPNAVDYASVLDVLRFLQSQLEEPNTTAET